MESLNSVLHTVPPIIFPGWLTSQKSLLLFPPTLGIWSSMNCAFRGHKGEYKAYVQRTNTHKHKHASTGRGQSLLHYASPIGIQEPKALYKLAGNSTQGSPVTIFFCMSSDHCQVDYYLQVLFLMLASTSRATLLDSLDCQLIVP